MKAKKDTREGVFFCVVVCGTGKPVPYVGRMRADVGIGSYDQYSAGNSVQG